MPGGIPAFRVQGIRYLLQNLSDTKIQFAEDCWRVTKEWQGCCKLNIVDDQELLGLGGIPVNNNNNNICDVYNSTQPI